MVKQFKKFKDWCKTHDVITKAMHFAFYGSIVYAIATTGYLIAYCKNYSDAYDEGYKACDDYICDNYLFHNGFDVLDLHIDGCDELETIKDFFGDDNGDELKRFLNDTPNCTEKSRVRVVVEHLK